MMQGRTVSRRRARLGIDLTILGLIGVLLIAALGAGGASLYKQFYSPSAFVHRYLDLLASGRAADALRVPGVALDLAVLQESGIHGTASEALLRHAALAPLDDIEIVSDIKKDGVHQVKVSYKAGGVEGRTTFSVVQDGWVGVTPAWRFERSPLAEIELTVRGSDTFAVNGFAIDRRQVAAHEENPDPLDPLHLLVLTPGLYSVTVDSAIAATPGVSVLSDKASASTPVDVQAQPTAKFVEVVQQQVEQFLSTCAKQEVLLPTSCPFGLEVQNRLAPGSMPKWSITSQPKVTVVPDGASWAIPATDAMAHIDVEIQSLYDGAVRELAEDVPFQVNGTIQVLPNGSVSIRVGSPS
ncbi:hypothetical protein [Microbacterium sp. H1-D42]|uniref:hypothetical protein n=1 Tax=Microbacterium sp. H1-D42 TaxID=2925844 RepID=UPI001F530641|nr:hypothetical protein [Microbacterium sp. H1-D42]UNK71017.1 hypothetical protein MNR00_00820 [Microbacterium sp. H1-D42]